MPTPRDELRRLAREERTGAGRPKPDVQRSAFNARIEQARTFITGTVTPAMEQAKAQITEEMPDREGDVTTTVEYGDGGLARLAIRVPGKPTSTYVAEIVSAATVDGIETTFRVSPSLGTDNKPHFTARTTPLEVNGKPADQASVKEILDFLALNYAATIRMLRAHNIV